VTTEGNHGNPSQVNHGRDTNQSLPVYKSSALSLREPALYECTRLRGVDVRTLLWIAFGEVCNWKYLYIG